MTVLGCEAGLLGQLLAPADDSQQQQGDGHVAIPGPQFCLSMMKAES